MNNRIPIGSNMPRLNPMQMLQQLQQHPAQMLQRAGLNVPGNLSDPNQIIQHLMNSGQVTQQRYEQARQFLSQMRR